MIDGELSTGDVLWWAPHDARAFERVQACGIVERDGVAYVRTENTRTKVKYWNREIRVRALCKREEKRKATPKSAGGHD